MQNVDLGKILIVVGSFVIILGLAITFFGRASFVGKLPGDIRIEKENFSFYFPFTTCILLSVILSVIFWLFSKR